MIGSQRFSRVGQVVGSDGVVKIGGATTVVAGVGNIGGQTLYHLAMMGMHLVLIDRGVVREENLGTQGFTEDRIGLPKVEARRLDLARINPGIKIEAIQADIEDLGLSAFRKADFVCCCLDNRRGRLSINELAARNGVPWVDAAVDGSGTRFFGRVAAYDPDLADAPCYLCPHDSESLREIMREGAGPGCPTWRWERQERTAPATIAISAIGGAVASIQVLWGLKLLLDQGKEIVGKEVYLDLDANVLSVHKITRNPACLFDHRVFSVRPLGRSVHEATPLDSFAVAEENLGEGVTLELHRRSLVTEIRCPNCSAVRRPHRILTAMSEAEAACACGSVMQPVSTGLLDRFSKEDAAAFLHRSWSDIGLGPDDVFSFSKGGREIHLVCEG